MKSSTQPSFRRIMLLRILLVSIPILLIGVAIAFRKARTSLLYTARQNLAESAVRKAETVEASVQSLQMGLVAVSESLIVRTGSPDDIRASLEELASRVLADTERSHLKCLELLDSETQVPQFSLCESPSASSQQFDQPWPQDRSVLMGDRFPIQRLSVDLASSSGFSTEHSSSDAAVASEAISGDDFELNSAMDSGGKLNVIVETPVYDADNSLRYILRAEAQLSQIENVAPKSLLGYTLVVREDGTILAHPLADQVGTHIREGQGSDRFESAINNALRGEQDVRHLFDLTGDQREWLAGYSAIDIAISPTQNETWVVLAITPLNSALQGLQDIKRILIILTGMLLVAHLSAVLYTARDLARPIEQLGQYASHIHDHQIHAIPKNFRIREINHLAEVLEAMVRRLEDRAEELELARQEAENANQLKSEFLANTSHELRTPLNAIIGCIRLIQDGCCDNREEELEFLERADQSAIHLLKIINDLLDVAKIEAGTLVLSMEFVNISEVLRNVINMQTVEAQRKGLWLKAQPLADGIMVKADVGKLKQVLLNIIYNAVKFTDQGGITVTQSIVWCSHDERPTINCVNLAKSKRHADMSEAESGSVGSSEPSDGAVSLSSLDSTASTPVEIDDRPSPVISQEAAEQLEHPFGHNFERSRLQPWLAIAITDTGIGIDPSQQHKLFRPFVMVDGSTTRKFEGTGLGLAISRNLVELMHGTITLTSEGLNQGTTVTITLPVVQLPSELAESLDLSIPSIPANGSPLADAASSHTSLNTSLTSNGSQAISQHDAKVSQAQGNSTHDARHSRASSGLH